MPLHSVSDIVTFSNLGPKPQVTGLLWLARDDNKRRQFTNCIFKGGLTVGAVQDRAMGPGGPVPDQTGPQGCEFT